jgi:hypothetical protein
MPINRARRRCSWNSYYLQLRGRTPPLRRSRRCERVMSYDHHSHRPSWQLDRLKCDKQCPNVALSCHTTQPSLDNTVFYTLNAYGHFLKSVQSYNGAQDSTLVNLKNLELVAPTNCPSSCSCQIYHCITDPLINTPPEDTVTPSTSMT